MRAAVKERRGTRHDPIWGPAGETKNPEVWANAVAVVIVIVIVVTVVVVVVVAIILFVEVLLVVLVVLVTEVFGFGLYPPIDVI